MARFSRRKRVRIPHLDGLMQLHDHRRRWVEAKQCEPIALVIRFGWLVGGRFVAVGNRCLWIDFTQGLGRRPPNVTICFPEHFGELRHRFLGLRNDFSQRQNRSPADVSLLVFE